METKINIQRLCEVYEIERSFVISICEADLITLYSEGNQDFITVEELPFLERMLRLHQDLGINEEGLHTIHHLLERVTDMKEEIRQLRNRLRLYEDF
ncbi:chaperone modulator CbpM [Robertkochia flava]|uniref:chaperone modulator CbpM n=1 Tax=Robertkochia flava TaxID=3447986 RepID=UPI001CCDF232|nr:chaperone modulator CbpM [Robertkochia marina]